MSLSTLDWSIIIIFLFITIGIGVSFTSKASKSISNFFLGGRNLPWYVAGVSMVATTFAADTPLAVTELVADKGIAGNWLWWNMLTGGMLTTFLFARLWRRANILTEVELIEVRYSGQPAALLRGFKAVYLGLFMNSLIIGWVNVALIALLKVFFGLDFKYAVLVTGAAMLFVAFYSSLSGLLGVAITDMIQFVIAMVGCIILAIVVVNLPEVGGIGGMKAKLDALSPGTLNFFPTIGSGSSGAITAFTLTAGAFLAHAGFQWWASWYPGAEPGGGGYIAQRMMSAKNEKHAVGATLFFQIAHYCIRPWPWILVALCTLILYPDLAAADKKLGFVMAIKDHMPSGLKGLLLVAFFAAYMSTISTQLNFGASFLVNDLYARFLQPKASQKELVWASRITTGILMITGLIVSLFVESISDVWTFIIECGAGLGLVLILRWFWWRINAWSEITATIVPFVVYGVLQLIKWKLLIPLHTTYPSGIPPDIMESFINEHPPLFFPGTFFIIIAITTLAWFVVTFLTPPENESTLQAFYQRIKMEGAWKPIRQSLGMAKPPQQLPWLILCWLSAVVMTYSALFLFGKLCLMEWQAAGALLIPGVYCLLLLLWSMRKSGLFADPVDSSEG